MKLLLLSLPPGSAATPSRVPLVYPTSDSESESDPSGGELASIESPSQKGDFESPRQNRRLRVARTRTRITS